jgi:hypothetical protein
MLSLSLRSRGGERFRVDSRADHLADWSATGSMHHRWRAGSLRNVEVFDWPQTVRHTASGMANRSASALPAAAAPFAVIAPDPEGHVE